VQAPAVASQASRWQKRPRVSVAGGVDAEFKSVQHLRRAGGGKRNRGTGGAAAGPLLTMPVAAATFHTTRPLVRRQGDHERARRLEPGCGLPGNETPAAASQASRWQKRPRVSVAGDVGGVQEDRGCRTRHGSHGRLRQEHRVYATWRKWRLKLPTVHKPVCRLAFTNLSIVSKLARTLPNYGGY